MTSRNLEYVVQVVGGDAGAATLAKMKTALDDKVKGDDSAAKASDTHAISMRMLHGAVMETAEGISKFNPQIGEMAAALGGGATMVAHLSEAMGSFGTALGLANIAMNAIAHDLAQLKAAEIEETAALQAQTTARTSHIASIQQEVAAINTRMVADQADAAISARIAAGTATLAEVEADSHQKMERYTRIVQANTEAHEHLEHALDEEVHSGLALPSTIQASSDALDANEASTRAAQSALARLSQEERAAIAANSAYATSVLNVAAALEKQKRAERETAATHRGGGRTRNADMQFSAQDVASQGGGADLLNGGVGAEQDLDAFLFGQAGGAPTITGAQPTSGAKDVAETARKAEKTRHEEAMAHVKAEIAQWSEFGGAVGSIFNLIADSEGKSAKAQKQGAEIKLVGQGMTETIAGAADAAQAISDAASENYLGAVLHAISSGEHFAVGARAFAMAGSGGGGGGGAGGGGGGAGAAPSRPAAAGASGGSGTTVVNNFNGPIMSGSDEAQLGRMMFRAQNSATSRGYRP